MVQWFFKKLLGTRNYRILKKIWPIVRQINEIEAGLQNQPEEVLRQKTADWQARLAKIEDQAELAATLEEILPEAFAVVKNAARRMVGREFTVCDQAMKWDMIHFDVQLIGGVGLHRGMIAEMATGEGKTLVGTLPVYLNALTGRGVHLVTVNDYLAKRDSEWMGQLYQFLGLTVGVIQNSQYPDLRREQYACDITYGTNSEFGFDYLRDNGMAQSRDEQVQRGHYFAIVDEVDSVLIDEARTPLIISGPVAHSTHQFDRYKPLVEQLVRKQNVLVNEQVAEAKRAFEAGDAETGGRCMFKVKLGHPRNRGLMRMMEDTEMRKGMEKSELTFYQDTQKTALFEIKEELLYSIDERSHEADLSEKGRAFLNPDDPDSFVLPDLATAFAEIDGEQGVSKEQRARKKDELQRKMDSQAEKMHNISQLLKAYCLYEKDREYVVEDNKVMIVDEHTGRKMPGRRWSDGLHQAVEAKEGVKIDKETQTLATITIQNYFRLYHKLGGMTGTAETEAAEFRDIYKLDLLIVPTNRPVQRKDENDHIYKTEREKYNAVIKRIEEAHAKGQPMLIGTASVDSSEKLSRLLKRGKIPHSVLNAKHHGQEAEIVARAGQRGAVTVSTNMAGRGTDIKLGEGVADLGGLLVLATERHESRRIDRQLRGRCARQGDPGQSIFFISFEDSLMRNFGAAERMTSLMERFGLEEGQELQHPWLNKSVETAQKRVEARNYQMRKRTLEFDDVMNSHRSVVYGYRDEIINVADPHDLMLEVIDEGVPAKTQEFVIPENKEAHIDVGALLHWVHTTFPVALSAEQVEQHGTKKEVADELVIQRIKDSYKLKIGHEELESRKMLERHILLNAVDRLWQEHLYNMDGLREGVFLRSYGQKDPLVEYKNEAYVIFVQLMDNIKGEVLHNLFRSTTSVEGFRAFLAHLQQQVVQGQPAPPSVGPVILPSTSTSSTTTTTSSGYEPEPAAREENPDGPRIILPVKREQPAVGRNDPCPCGSGKKYKQCHGK